MSIEEGARAVHVVVRGQVQGVGYRAWLHHQAELHGLEGWVRNRLDGTVEAVLRGPPDLVQVMLKACHDGPQHGHVDAVEVEPAAEDGSGAKANGRFVVRDTA
jgi:acylphosphatase